MPGRRVMRERRRLVAFVDGAGADLAPAPVNLAGRLGRVARAGWPWAGSGDGRLPALLVGLTVVTGLVDAVSYLGLSHVFVANMTGNVVFLGFALAGAPGLSAPASLAALGAFLLGALAGGRIAIWSRDHRARHLRTAMTTAAASVLFAVILARDPRPARARRCPLCTDRAIGDRDGGSRTRRPGGSRCPISPPPSSP